MGTKFHCFCSQYKGIYVQEGERENMRVMLVFLSFGS